MAYGIEKRRCRRFEVPGMEMKFKKKGLLFFEQKFSKPCTVINISKGGAIIVCEKKLSIGKKLLVQLLIPDGTLLNLNCIVRRQEQMVGSNKKYTAMEFMPYSDRHGSNTADSLDVLRKLDEKYGSDNQ